MYRISENKVKVSLAGMALILTGLVIKNSSEQIHMTQYNSLSIILFLLGMGVVAYSFSMGHRYTFKKDDTTYINFIAVFLIIISVFQIKMAMKSSNKPPMIWPGFFILGTGLLGYNAKQSKLGLLSSAVIIFSIMILLPWQRRQHMIDGPGMILLTLGCIGLALSNSLTKKERKQKSEVPEIILPSRGPQMPMPPQTPPPPTHPSISQSPPYNASLPDTNGMGEVPELEGFSPKNNLLDYTLGVDNPTLPPNVM